MNLNVAHQRVSLLTIHKVSVIRLLAFQEFQIASIWSNRNSLIYSSRIGLAEVPAALRSQNNGISAVILNHYHCAIVHIVNDKEALPNKCESLLKIFCFLLQWNILNNYMNSVAAKRWKQKREIIAWSKKSGKERETKSERKINEL